MAGLRRLDEVLAEQEQAQQPGGLPAESAGPFRDLGPRLRGAYYGSVQAAPRAYLGAGLRALGFDQAGQAMADSAAQYQQLSQQAQQGTLNNWDDVHGVGDFTRYATGAVGNAISSYLPGLATALVTRRPALGLATMFPQEAGETALQAPQDADPGRIFASATAKGAVNTAIEAAPWMHLFGRGPLAALGQSMPSNPLVRFGGRMATQMAGEGGTEVAQEAVGQQAQSFLNPARDRSQDLVGLREAGLQGALGAAPFGVMAGASGAARDSAAAMDGKLNQWRQALNERFPQRGDPVKLRPSEESLPGVLEQLKSPAGKLNEQFASTEGKSTEDIMSELRSEDKKFSLLTGVNTAVEDLEGRDSYLLNALDKRQVQVLSNTIGMRRFAEAVDDYVRGDGPWGIRNNPGMTPDVDPFRQAVAELFGKKGRPDFKKADELFERYASAVPQEQRGELWQGDAGSRVRLAEDAKQEPDSNDTFAEQDTSSSYHFWDKKNALPFSTKPPPSAYKALRDSGELKTDPLVKNRRAYGPQSMLEYALENGLNPEDELQRLRDTVNSTYEARLGNLRTNWQKAANDKAKKSIHLDAKRLTQLRDALNVDTDPNEILSGLHIIRTEALPGDETTASDTDLAQYSRQKYGRKDSPSTLKFWKAGASEPLTLNASMILATELKRDANAQMRLNAKGAPRAEYLLSMLHDGIARVMNRGYQLNLAGQKPVTEKGTNDRLGLRLDMPVWREKSGGKWTAVTYGELVKQAQKGLPKSDPSQAQDVPPQTDLAAAAHGEGFQVSGDMQDWMREHATKGDAEAVAALEAAQAQADGYAKPLAATQRQFDILDGKIDSKKLTRDERLWLEAATKDEKTRGQSLKVLSLKRRELLHGRGSWQALVSELRGEQREADLGEGATSTQEIAEAQDVQERQMPRPRLVDEQTGINLDTEKRTAAGEAPPVPGNAPVQEPRQAVAGEQLGTAEAQRLMQDAFIEASESNKPKAKRPKAAEPNMAPQPAPEKLTGPWKQAVASGLAAETERTAPQRQAEKEANLERRAAEAAERLTTPKQKTANFDDGTPRVPPTNINPKAGEQLVDNPKIPKPRELAAGVLRPPPEMRAKPAEAPAKQAEERPKATVKQPEDRVAYLTAQVDKGLAPYHAGKDLPSPTVAAKQRTWAEGHLKSLKEQQKAQDDNPDLDALVIKLTELRDLSEYRANESSVEADKDRDNGTARTSSMDPRQGAGMTRRVLTKANRADLEKEVFRLLGDQKIKVTFRGAMQIAKGGAHGSFEYKNGQRLIEIASNIGLAPAESAAHHEALHGLFALLGDPTGPAELRQAATAIRNAVRSARVKGKLRELLKDHPEAWKQVLHDPEEAAAYTFQFWRAGLITNQDLNPGARNFFERLARYIRKFFGLVSTNEKALAIFNEFQAGKFANVDPSIAGAIIRDMRLKTLGEMFKYYGGPAYTTGEKLLVTATDRLRQTGVPALERLANMYHKETNNEHGRLGFLQRRARQKNLWQHKANVFLKSATQEQLARALKDLQNQNEASTDPLVLEVRKLLDEMHAYQREAGVSQTEYDHLKSKNAGKDIWTDIPLRKAKNYWPRLWDFDIIQKNETEFKELLVKHGNLDAPTAEKIFSDLMKDDKTPLRTGVEYTPYMLSASTRVLTFINKTNAADFAKFQYQDLVFVLTMYIYQATHRAEYAKTFGNHGETISALIDKAREEGATKEQLDVATKAVQALNGTLGWDMDRDRRQMMQNLMAYENIVLLPLVLVQNFADVMGIAMRSESMTEAWKAFKLGVQDLVREVRKQPRSAQDGLADMIGLMDDEIELANYGMAYDGVFIGGFAKRVNDRFFKYTGMQSWNRSMRTAAMVTAINFIQQHWTRIKKGEDTDGTSARKLEELGLKVDDIRINPLVGGDRPAILASHFAASLRKSEDHKDVREATTKMQEAIFRFVDGAVIRPNAAHRPIWGSDPHWMLVFHLKQFTYSFTQVFHKYIAKELDHGNATPGYIMLTLLPFSIGTGLIKAALLGRPMDLSPLALIWQAISTTGATGTAGFAIDAFEDLSRNQAPGVSFIGPTAGHALQALQTLAGSPQDSWSSLALRSVPASPIVKAVVQ